VNCFGCKSSGYRYAVQVLEKLTPTPGETDFNYIRYCVSLENIKLFGINIFTVDFMMEVVRRGTLANLQE
jgi:hypothetical protein